MLRTNDLALYSTYSSEWWEPTSPRFRSLQKVNEHLIPFVLEALSPLEGANIIDLGCGGGLLSKPLAEKGAQVTGIDISEPSVKVAKERIPSGTFFTADIKATGLPPETFDGAVVSDVLEHIVDYPKALEETARLLKPNGKLFVATINRTFLAKVGALWLSEGLRLVPAGTHEYSLFITPDELKKAAGLAGFEAIKTQGTKPRLLQTIKSWTIHLSPSENCSVLYWATFIKKAH